MKNFLVLLSLFAIVFSVESFAQGDAPPILKGQAQTTTTVATTIELPNSQVTKTAAGKGLIENGQRNILLNPGYEHLSYNTSWNTSITSTATITLGVNTSTPLFGKKSITVQCAGGASGGTCLIYQDVTTGRAFQGLSSIFVVSDTAWDTVNLRGAQVYARKDGSNFLAVTVPSTDPQIRKVPFTLGTTSSGIGVLITAGASQTINVTLDEAFTGAADLKVESGASETQSYIASLTSTSTLSSVLDADGSGLFTVSFVSSKVRFTALKPISFSGSGSFETTSAAPTSAQTGWYLNGTQISQSHNFEGSGGSSVQGSSAGADVLLAANEYIEYQGAIYSGGTFTNNFVSATATYSTKTYSYSSTNADTDWKACSLGASSQGITVSSSDLLCRRDGSNLWMKGNISYSATAASELRFGLPTWDGNTLTSTGQPATIHLLGTIGVNASSATYFSSFALVEPSKTYLVFSQQASVTNALTKQNGTALGSSGTLSIQPIAIPIAGWEDSNITIAQFNGLESCSSSLACASSLTAKIDSSRALLSQELASIFTVSTGATGISTVNYSAMGLTQVPAIILTAYSPCNQAFVSGTASTTAVTVNTRNSSSTDTNCAYDITVIRQGTDAIYKTARAVATDANVKSTGATGVDIQSVYFGSGASCATVCSASPCTICKQTGTKITSIVRAGTGSYQVTGIDGTKYQCTGTGYSGSARIPLLHDLASSSSTQATISAQSTDAAYASVICVGVP